MSLTIRLAEEKDVGAITLLEKECFRLPWTENDVRSAMRRYDFFGLVAEDDEGTAGFLLGSLLFESAEVYRVAVSPSRRGRGYGGQILDAFIGAVKEQGAEQILLEVRVSNAPAIGLYKSRDFDVARRRKNYYEGVEDAFEMVKFL
jgi:ribosomal-protein-alanine acetyltransferase